MVVVWLTGLPASGKTTVGLELKKKLESVNTAVVFLDGDDLRKTLSADLGFSRQDREMHARRVLNLVQSLSEKGTWVIVALITPYRSSREMARKQLRDYVEVWVKTSIAECIKRDPKGLYKKAIGGQIRNFTGIHDPYEEPVNPELVIETEKFSPTECADMIISKLAALGYCKT
ncbi:MAG: adenylyl-sulfate kinase [Nitrososphaera sp.]